MVEYLKTKKGYFYKLKKMVKKKRISREEFNKKNKTRKNKKMIGGAGEPIYQGDIMYQDELVCILSPGVKKGIIIWTHFTQPEGMDSLCNLGLKTGKQLQKEDIDFGRSKIHPYIFFRAPYYSRDIIDYTSVESEIISSYGEGQIGTEPRIFIRVDPDRTFVFSSEIRTKGEWYDRENVILMNSKKTLSKYLQIINDNMKIKEEAIKPDQNIWYNLFTSQAVVFPPRAGRPPLPFDKQPIERMSEILVSIPHLPPEYVVLCTKDTKNRKRSRSPPRAAVTAAAPPSRFGIAKSATAKLATNLKHHLSRWWPSRSNTKYGGTVKRRFRVQKRQKQTMRPCNIRRRRLRQ